MYILQVYFGLKPAECEVYQSLLFTFYLSIFSTVTGKSENVVEIKLNKKYITNRDAKEMRIVNDIQSFY